MGIQINRKITTGLNLLFVQGIFTVLLYVLVLGVVSFSFSSHEFLVGLVNVLLKVSISEDIISYVIIGGFSFSVLMIVTCLVFTVLLFNTLPKQGKQYSNKFYVGITSTYLVFAVLSVIGLLFGLAGAILIIVGLNKKNQTVNSEVNNLPSQNQKAEDKKELVSENDAVLVANYQEENNVQEPAKQTDEVSEQPETQVKPEPKQKVSKPKKSKKAPVSVEPLVQEQVPEQVQEEVVVEAAPESSKPEQAQNDKEPEAVATHVIAPVVAKEPKAKKPAKQKDPIVVALVDFDTPEEKEPETPNLFSIGKSQSDIVSNKIKDLDEVQDEVLTEEEFEKEDELLPKPKKSKKVSKKKSKAKYVASKKTKASTKKSKKSTKSTKTKTSVKKSKKSSESLPKVSSEPKTEEKTVLLPNGKKIKQSKKVKKIPNFAKVVTPSDGLNEVPVKESSFVNGDIKELEKEYKKMQKTK
ncbi:MAG: hypothetical protein LBC44_04700 [Mycoplasmataceae bacterium]|jgi:hypothetical protein|nr:hypothetical protein [Mycoplasmataceae bacterium]